MGNRVVIYDKTASPAILPMMWGMGKFLHGGISFGVTSWDQAYRLLLDFSSSQEIDHLQIWSHGHQYGPIIGDKTLEMQYLPKLNDMLGWQWRPMAVTPSRTIWFRSCSIASNPIWMEHAARTFKCPVAGHTQVISSPNPLQQKGFVVLMPDEQAQWGLQEGASISTLTMELPWKKGRSWLHTTQ